MYEILKRINILTTLLSLVSMGVIMLTILLILMINNILSHAGGQFSTIIGFVASLITLPTAFKIKTYYGAVYFRKLKKYEINNYHRFILTISFFIQLFAIIVCIISIAKYKHADKSFTKSITEYQQSKHCLNSKKYVDNVQFNFQCCGRENYKEWFGSTCNNGTVPFSCCKVLNLEECFHYDIENHGTKTINTVGCGKKLINFVLSTLLTELFLYLFIFFLVILLLRSLNFKEEDDLFTVKHGNKKRKWSTFVNSAPNRKKSKTHSPASIMPSFMDTLAVKKKRNENLF